jgi:hypothetical protein
MGTFGQFIEECVFEQINNDIFSLWKELVGFAPVKVKISNRHKLGF